MSTLTIHERLSEDGAHETVEVGVEERVKISGGVCNRIGVGDADAIESKRLRFAGKRGLEVGGRKLDGGFQKSRST